MIELQTLFTYFLYGCIGFVVIFFLATQPITPILQILFKRVPNKFDIILQFITVWIKFILIIPLSILAPVIVPIALLFTKWEDDHLPSLFTLWDNDASINGDIRTDDPADGRGGWNLKPVPLEKDSAEAISMCYWAKGHHPRSFYARWVWLGLRNRASKAAIILGIEPDHTYEPTVLGDPATENGHAGWKLTILGDHYRYYSCSKFGPFCIRVHYGYKIGPKLGPYFNNIPLVSIAFSLLKWKS